MNAAGYYLERWTAIIARCAPPFVAATPALTRRRTVTTSIPVNWCGFYHSHPDHPARWSLTDFQEAHWIGCSYVITAVEKGKAAVTNSFTLTGTSEEDKALVDEPIVVE